MRRREKLDTAGLRVTFEALAGRQRGRGIFAIEDEAEEVARRTKLAQMTERSAVYERGDEGNRRRCPQCGQWQKYKGERAREWVFDWGTVTVRRAYYVCLACGETSCPLDEQLGLVEGKEQGRLREKLALLAVLTPYHQAPQVCQTLLGSERHAMTVRGGRYARRTTWRRAAITKPYLTGSATGSTSKWMGIGVRRARAKPGRRSKGIGKPKRCGRSLATM